MGISIDCRCNICPYSTHLKANFHLHQRTDKHIQRIQMVRFIYSILPLPSVIDPHTVIHFILIDNRFLPSRLWSIWSLIFVHSFRFHSISRLIWREGERERPSMKWGIERKKRGVNYSIIERRRRGGRGTEGSQRVAMTNEAWLERERGTRNGMKWGVID